MRQVHSFGIEFGPQLPLENTVRSFFSRAFPEFVELNTMHNTLIFLTSTIAHHTMWSR